MTLTQIAKECPDRNYTHLLCVHERNKKPWSLSFSVLPHGPTMVYRIRKYIPVE